MLRPVELEVRHLRALCAIADTGSVHKAARQLGMTQPSLTTQLRRIEQAIGGQLFSRERTGSRPTLLGRSVLARARPIVTQMTELIAEAKDAAGLGAAGGEARLRLGSTASRAVPGWLRRLHARLPEADITFQTDVSAHTLLRMVAANQLDAAYVHEVEGSPLRVPEGVELRVLVHREPQFVAVPARHPAATSGRDVCLTELADEQWMVDPSVDGDWDGLRRVFTHAGVAPRIVYGDYMSAGDLVAAGEVVTPCQATSQPRPGMAIVPLRGDPLGVRLVVGFRAGRTLLPESDAVFRDLRSAYEEVAWSSPVYAHWLRAHEHPALPVVA
ncbi:LysR family transcriptional regulator [Streptomyces iconiensis]|uniref:LysR family transcriptional regulator n=1 Tax=Streptomyces iconiensis TaxID=1384038 RepID=A0ABT7A5I5_9ACTN|nr:LysR family transcriptional regulator [Streptomyces iconiensis]MDJ1136585.1 LysR family transcriptional regulator [Streptomyces iconiensis]